MTGGDSFLTGVVALALGGVTGIVLLFTTCDEPLPVTPKSDVEVRSPQTLDDISYDSRTTEVKNGDVAVALEPAIDPPYLKLSDLDYDEIVVGAAVPTLKFVEGPAIETLATITVPDGDWKRVREMTIETGGKILTCARWEEADGR